MGKTSPYTGTQKKANKAKAKAEKFAAEEYISESKHAKPYKRAAQHDLRQISKGKYAPPTDVKSLTKEFEKAQKYAGKAAKEQFEPMKQKALSDYQRYTTPSLASQYSARGSAAKQALKESGEDLQRTLTSDFAGLKNSIAGNYMNQLSQNRNQDINTRLQSLAGTMGQPVSPVSLGMQPAYNPSKGGSSGIGGELIGGGLGALGSYLGAGGTFGLGAGAAGAGATSTGIFSLLAASSIMVKDNIQAYDKGLETIPHIDVKNYDYTIDVPGRKENRVGVIAEQLPEELRVNSEGVESADIYGLVGLLINCVKQLDQKVKDLEAKNV